MVVRIVWRSPGGRRVAAWQLNDTKRFVLYGPEAAREGIISEVFRVENIYAPWTCAILVKQPHVVIPYFQRDDHQVAVLTFLDQVDSDL